MHDLGFCESCLLHRHPVVHPAEKVLLPHPFKIGGITPQTYMANKLLEIDGLTDTPHHRNHDPSFYNIRHILNNHRRTHNASYLLDPLGLKPILTHAPLLFLEISAPQKLAA